ncbi:MAG: hypothetical protein R2712_29615 [Vicinamibacterales bacterium]
MAGALRRDPDIVGRSILLDDVPAEVVGVMPRGFRLPTDFTEHAAEPTEAWRPIRFDAAELERGSHGYYAAAVLARRARRRERASQSSAPWRVA